MKPSLFSFMICQFRTPKRTRPVKLPDASIYATNSVCTSGNSIAWFPPQAAAANIIPRTVLRRLPAPALHRGRTAGVRRVT